MTTGGTKQDWLAVVMLLTPADAGKRKGQQNNFADTTPNNKKTPTEADTPNNKKNDENTSVKRKNTNFDIENQNKKGEAYAEGGDAPITTSVKLKLKGADIELENITTSKIEYNKRDRLEYSQLRQQFNNSIKKQFLKSLAKNKTLLKEKGFSDVDIQKMENGLVPGNYQVHHKKPLDDGGTNDFDNLVLIKNDPYHKALTNYQNSVTRGMKVGETKLVDWYVMKGNIYP